MRTEELASVPRRRSLSSPTPCARLRRAPPVLGRRLVAASQANIRHDVRDIVPFLPLGGGGVLHRPSQLADDFKNRIQLLCDGDPVDFDAWVSLIRSVEETSPDDIEIISLVYHCFFLEFPLCYGCWIKYAAHKARLCTNKDVVEVYEKVVEAVPHSVDLWVSYCGFGVSAYEDPTKVRSLFERALSLVGKDYPCYHLWDKFIEFKTSQKQLIPLATIYMNTLKFPAKKLHMYYESFRKLVALLELEVAHGVAEKLSESLQNPEVEDDEYSELDLSILIANLFDQKGGQLRLEALK